MIERDLDYYRRRLAEERARAAQCELSEIKLVHRQLAEMYGERIERLAGENVARAPTADFFDPPPPGGGGRRSLTEGEDTGPSM